MEVCDLIISCSFFWYFLYSLSFFFTVSCKKYVEILNFDTKYLNVSSTRFNLVHLIIIDNINM
jgi:hypothetical protein